MELIDAEKAKKAEKEGEAEKEVEEGGETFFKRRSSYVGLVKEEKKRRRKRWVRGSCPLPEGS